jgi:hypothetical protein
MLVWLALGGQPERPAGVFTDCNTSETVEDRTCSVIVSVVDR